MSRVHLESEVVLLLLIAWCGRCILVASTILFILRGGNYL